MNNYNSPYEGISYSKRAGLAFNQTQSKLMTRAFLATGISFVLICVLSFAFFYAMPMDNPDVADNLLIISPILVIVSSIMGFFIKPRVSGGMGFIVATYAIYIIAQAIGFGGLFYAISWSNRIGFQSTINIQDILSIFGVAGLMFVGMAIIGATMSRKSGMKFGSFLMAATLAWILGSVIFSVVLMFTSRTGSFDWIVIVATVVGGLLNLGYIVFIVFQMKQNSDFVSLVDNDHFTTTMACSYGFWMLVNLVGLVWQLIRLLLIVRRY